MRWGFWIGSAALVVGVLVWQQDALLPRLRAAWPGATVKPAGALPAPAAATRARKCLQADGSMVYTDGSCPAGTREQPMDAGSLSVLPAAPRPPEPKPSAPDRARALDALR